MRTSQTRRLRRIVLFALLALWLAPTAQGAVFTVTKTADTNDACLAIDCSLREAINAANVTPGQDFISFSIGTGVQTISLATSLPALTDIVTIDGTTQPGFTDIPPIQLDGEAGASIGLDLGADNIQIRGLAIGRFLSHGIRIRATAVDTRVSLTNLGTDSTGLLTRGNGGDGIEVEGAEAQIGWIGEPNRIIDNSGAGVRFVDPDASGGFVEHNVIGVNAAGVAVPNVEGVVLEAGANGTHVRDNQISGNTGTGLLIRSSSNNTVQLNKIGTNAAGTAAIGNGLGIHLIGDAGAESNGNTIGGADPDHRNVISGNATDGILVEPFAPNTVERTTIVGNRIGTNESGTDNVSNGGDGVHVLPGVGPNRMAVGGTAAGEANTIAFNGRNGVAVENGSERVSIVGNELFGNAGLGIDLGSDGVTANDAGDADSGANGLLNFPTLANARTAGNTIAISGVYSGAASGSFQLDFYRSAACDPTGFGEGRVHLGSKFVHTTPAGSIPFTASFAGTGVASEVVTATATDADGNTSELSGCVGITVGQTFVVNSAADPGAGGCDLAECTLREAITASNGTGAFDAIHFAIGSGVVTIAPGSALPGIGSPVAIDGTTQPGYIDTPIVELDGTGAGANVDGLVLFGDGSTVKGLVINRFQGSGIVLSGELGRHTVQNNFLGTDVAGTADRGNGDAGVLPVSPLNLVGGTAATGNLISGNTDGIDVASDRNVVRGNRIGTDVTGTAAIPNQIGVMIDSGNDNNVIGGPDRALGNQISGNTGAGIEIVGSTGIAIEGNLIGTDFTAEEPLPNATGIYIFQASSNTVGGALNGGAGNVISGNAIDGIRLDALDVNLTANNVIAGNRIGTDANGTDPVGNGASGVRISQNGLGNNVVGPDAEGRNVIAFNGGEGIRVEAESQRERLLFNDIHDNDELGIDLNGDGLTPNDPVDADVGANALQNFPVVTSAVRDGNELTVEGGLNSSPNSTFTVYLFHSPTCDPSGHGEGALVMGPLPPVVTDGDGNGSFSVTVASSIPTGEAITATAISPTGNTSEFSECRTVTSAQVLTVNSAADPGTGVCDLAECTLREAIEASNASPVQENIVFALPEPAVIQPTSALPATTDSVVIDGWTQPGAGPFAPPVVVLNGTLAGVASGLTIAGGSSIVRGLVVNGFAAASQAGILLTGGDTNLLTANYVGVNGPGPDTPGTVAVPNRYGIVVEASSTGNTIDSNLVSGNVLDGIALETAGIGASTSDNSVFGNYVGTNATGTGALGNGGTGIDVEGNNNDIGGAFAGTGNLVSGNGGTGIDISVDEASGNTVRANLVGTDADGSAAVPNQRGMHVGGDLNTVGPGNVISGNTGNGLAIGGEEDDAVGNVVRGNTIGLDAPGLARLGNANGIVLSSLTDATTIGGTAPEHGNLISANAGAGVQVAGATNALELYGNRIGVTVTGVGEGNDVGVRLGEANGNFIGGTAPGQGNVIADSDDANVWLSGSNGNGIAGNWIGTDTGGTVDLGAINTGVRLTGASTGNTIGPANVIAFNGSTFTGVTVDGAASTGNRITENSIYSNVGLGIDLGEDSLTPNDPGDADAGPNGLQNFPVLTTASERGRNDAGAGHAGERPRPDLPGRVLLQPGLRPGRKRGGQDVPRLHGRHPTRRFGTGRRLARHGGPVRPGGHCHRHERRQRRHLGVLRLRRRGARRHPAGRDGDGDCRHGERRGRGRTRAVRGRAADRAAGVQERGGVEGVGSDQRRPDQRRADQRRPDQRRADQRRRLPDRRDPARRRPALLDPAVDARRLARGARRHDSPRAPAAERLAAPSVRAEPAAAAAATEQPGRNQAGPARPLAEPARRPAGLGGVARPDAPRGPGADPDRVVSALLGAADQLLDAVDPTELLAPVGWPFGRSHQRRADQRRADQRRRPDRRADQRRADQRRRAEELAHQRRADQRRRDVDADQRRADQRRPDQRRAREQLADQRRADQRRQQSGRDPRLQPRRLRAAHHRDPR